MHDNGANMRDEHYNNNDPMEKLCKKIYEIINKI
jgi:hypothetical protein